jgi:D-arabinose 1-dehydrogenase-like Zn-dependent alcohol dehydrogenase
MYDREDSKTKIRLTHYFVAVYSCNVYRLSNKAQTQMITAAQVFVEGNVAVITGASSGIGRATALTCAAKGMHVWLVDIDKDELAIAKDMCIDKCLDKNVQVRDKLS